MPSTDFILWCDLETTGNKDDDHILEIGLVLTEYDHNLNVLAAENWLITPGTRKAIGDIDPFVIEMHVKSGLWADLAKHRNNYEIVQADILRWIDLHTMGEKQHIPFAGSGVGHFDRKYINKYLPQLSDRLTYWPLDIGVIRRMERLAGLGYNTEHTEQKPHRALEDAYLAADEARMWMARQRIARGLE